MIFKRKMFRNDKKIPSSSAKDEGINAQSLPNYSFKKGGNPEKAHMLIKALIYNAIIVPKNKC